MIEMPEIVSFESWRRVVYRLEAQCKAEFSSYWSRRHRGNYALIIPRDARLDEAWSERNPSSAGTSVEGMAAAMFAVMHQSFPRMTSHPEYIYADDLLRFVLIAIGYDVLTHTPDGATRTLERPVYCLERRATNDEGSERLAEGAISRGFCEIAAAVHESIRPEDPEGDGAIFQTEFWDLFSHDDAAARHVLRKLQRRAANLGYRDA